MADVDLTPPSVGSRERSLAAARRVAGVDLEDPAAMAAAHAGTETKSVRRVRTPEGARKFGQPIGSVITTDADTSGWRPGQWVKGDIEDVRASIRAEKYADLEQYNREWPDYAYSHEDMTESARIQVENEIPEGSVVYENGPLRIVVKSGHYEPGPWRPDRPLIPAEQPPSTELIEAVANHLDALYAANPLGDRPMHVIFSGRPVSGDAAHAGKDTISLHPSSALTLDLPETEVVGNQMPTYNRTPMVLYTLTHEYGHVLSYRHGHQWISGRLHNELPKYTDEELRTPGWLPGPDLDGRLSVYGTMWDHPEGYAEAFAEWWLTGGQTRNASVLAYQGLAGWAPPVLEETKDIHSQVAVHTVGYGIGTVIASQSNTEPAKKRRRKRVRALAYRRQPRRPEGGTEA